MPIDQIERHPFIEDFNATIDPNISYEGIIIGSFPIHAITNDIDGHGNLITERFEENVARMKFFYGSKDSQLWDYISHSFGALNPMEDIKGMNPENRKNRALTLLHLNKLLISDVIYQTNRVEEKSEDTNLMETRNVTQHIVKQFELNKNLRQLIEKHKSIKNLYFTATGITGKAPFAWFKKLYSRKDLKWNKHQNELAQSCNINDRRFNIFLLPTPKPRGIHYGDKQKNPFFVNYLKDIDPLLLLEVQDVLKANRTLIQKSRLTQHRLDFLNLIYKQALVHQNMNFNGVV